MTGPTTEAALREWERAKSMGYDLVIAGDDLATALRERPSPHGLTVDEMERIAAEKGIPFLLDHLGLDGLANEVNALRRPSDAALVEALRLGDALAARMDEMDGRAWDMGRTNERVAWADFRERIAAARPEAEREP